MGTCPDTIKHLVDRFNQQSDEIRSLDYKEHLIRVDFIDPLMKELGWDVNNSQGLPLNAREVYPEDRLKVGGQTKAPDYSFRVGGKRKFFLEAKKPAVNIKENWEPAYQLRRYAWTAELAVSLLTDFEEFAVYDARIKPEQLEKASTARRDFLHYTQYLDRWDFLSGTFSRSAVQSGAFDRYCETEKKRGAQSFDDVFLSEIEAWRKAIAGSLARNNDDLDEGGLNFAVQRIIDRIIFLRIAEDRGTETVGQLQALLNGDHTYSKLCTLFRAADARYNSGLFHFDAAEKGRTESPDTLTPTLAVDDTTLKGIIKALYYPQSPYEFTVVSADILGSIYERFLGKVITLTAGHNARVEEKPEVRKAGGVYYTPTYIVEYIVKNTVGRLLGDAATPVLATPASPLPPTTGKGDAGVAATKTLKHAAKLKILDPACGSGSFLIGAYQFLLDWYLDQYQAAPAAQGEPAALATGKRPVLRPIAAEGEAGWALTIAERKRILLDHIHGVDLDGQAVEVTKLNLLLKCLEGETSQTLGFEQRLFRERALPDLGKNIKCGNSLIGTDIYGTDAWHVMSEEERRKINPFDYERAFPQVFMGKDGGFDAVIGNPPYVLAQALDNPAIFGLFASRFSVAKYKIDTYHLFLERAISLARRSGSVGYIVPNTFIRNRHALELRRYILEHTNPRTLRLFDYDVFDASVDTAILIADRTPVDGAAMVSFERSASPRETTSKSAALQTWRGHPKLEFLSSEGEAHEAIVEKIEGAGPPLGSVGTAYFGIQTFDRTKFVSHHRLTSAFRAVIDGGHISRYALAEPEEYVDFRPEAIKSGGKPAVYAQERIGVRQIGRVPVATLLPPGLPTLNTIYNIYFTQPTQYALRFVLGVMLSSTGRFFWLNRFFDQKKSFPKVKKPDLLSLPLANLSAIAGAANHDRLVCLVTTMLSLHTRLAAEKLPQRREQVQREIDATDRQIDQLVYQLYGLTDDEIRIVEEATA